MEFTPGRKVLTIEISTRAALIHDLLDSAIYNINDYTAEQFASYLRHIADKLNELADDIEDGIDASTKPYLGVESFAKGLRWNRAYPQDTLCTCGHPYYRHFDSYEGMSPVGCKYCDCFLFTKEGA